MDKVIMSVTELCKALMRISDLESADDCKQILRILHELGDVLWYEECGYDFQDLIILDPSVMLGMVREVVNHKYEGTAGESYEALWRDDTL